MWAFALRVLRMEGMLAGVLFGAAGRWDLPWCWAVLGVHASLMLLVVAIADPGLGILTSAS
jgi:hypothetical protein